MASASIPAQPGEKIAGKYQIERVIGTGGVGMVVAARHLVLGQVVALKFLLPGAAHDKNDVRRFEREAQSAVQLKNEHVCRVYDVGELEDGSPFIVLEYLEGQDLAHTLRSSGPLPIVEAVGYILQVCEAVAEAHSLGMVHRDLKPSNFFLTYRHDGLPLVKVLDFGIAKYKIELEQQDVRLTQTRALLGSPVYMSPEQVRSARTVDHRSDIWSLGVCLFELLTDTVPFGGETVTGVAAAVSADPIPPIARYRPDVPEDLAAVIERCLAKRPDDRFQSVADFAEALVPFGPSEATYSLYRISGALGIKRRTADGELRDSASRTAPAVSPEQVTQISQDETAERPTFLASTRGKIYLAVAVAVMAAVALFAILRSPQPNAATLVTSPNAPSAFAAVPSIAVPTAPVAAPPPLAAAPEVKPVDAPATIAAKPSSIGVTRTPKPQVTHPALPTRPNVATAANGRIDVTATKKTNKKSFAGGSIDDIVDTRH